MEGDIEQENSGQEPQVDKLINNEVMPVVDTEFIKIRFQQGPIKETGLNGTQIEDVLDILCKRLAGFQEGPFKCRENAIALTHMETALLWLKQRTAKRLSQGVEGRNVPHI